MGVDIENGVSQVNFYSTIGPDKRFHTGQSGLFSIAYGEDKLQSLTVKISEEPDRLE